MKMPLVANGSHKLAIVVALASLSMCVCARTEYFVDCTRPDDSGDGLTEATAKRTIQAAIDLTSPAGTDIVTVLPGVYDEGKRVSPADWDHEFRIVITNHVVLRSRDGAQKTFIKGSFGSGADNLGPGAVRGIYMRGSAYSVVEGFTITGCATTNTAANGSMHYGAAVVGSWNQYVLGCVISNNHALAGAGIFNCNAARCLFTRNKANSSAVGVNAWYWNCVMANNTGASALNYTKKMVNCTCTDLDGNIAGGGNQSFENCVLVGNGGDNGNASYTDLSNSVTDSADSVFKAVDEVSVTSASKYQFVAPALGDWRLLEDSDAIGIADWNKYYTLVSSGQKLTVAAENGYIPRDLADRYVYFDYAGNPISEDRPMDAGAIQGGVKIEGGRLDFLTAGFHRHEGDVPCRYGSYAYAEKWPSVLVCSRTAPDGKRTFGCRVSGSYVSPSCSYRFPNLEERFSFAFPPKGINSEITAYAVQRTYYVDDDGNDENDGSAPDKAFKTLQKAADSIKANGGSCNLVSVAAGAYNEGGGFNKGLENRLHVAGISVQFYAPEGPDVTFIEGAPDPKSEFHGLGPGATRCLYWFSSHREAAMRGFTFRNGHTSHTDGDKWDSADANQGGVAFISVESDGKVQFLDCVFSNNTALISAVNTGGDFTRCRFVNNRAINSQGSIGRNSTYRFCSFHGNGPGVYTLDNSVQNIYFCTLEGRTTPYQSNIYGSVIVNPGVASETIEKNTDFDGNVVSPGCTVKRKEGTEGELNYLSADPMLADLASGDMHLLAGSPALGAANVANITTLLHQVTVDMDGNAPNFIGGNMTAGAYQWPSMSVTVSGREGALEIQGGKLGSNALRPGATISVTAAERVNGRRFEGFVVNGEQMSPAERMFTYTVPQMPTEAMTIEAIYGNLGTIMVVR